MVHPMVDLNSLRTRNSLSSSLPDRLTVIIIGNVDDLHEYVYLRGSGKGLSSSLGASSNDGWGAPENSRDLPIQVTHVDY